MKFIMGFELLCVDDKVEVYFNRVVWEVVLLLGDLVEDGEENILLFDEQIEKEWKDIEREDDDSWMDIDYIQFEKEFVGFGSGGVKVEKIRGGKGGFGDVGIQVDFQKIVERFEVFLNDEDVGVDGVVLGDEDEDDDEMDVDDDDDESDEDEDWEDEDKEVGFDEEQFQRMMREMMGLFGDDGKLLGVLLVLVII